MKNDEWKQEHIQKLVFWFLLIFMALVLLCMMLFITRSEEKYFNEGYYAGYYAGKQSVDRATDVSFRFDKRSTYYDYDGPEPCAEKAWTIGSYREYKYSMHDAFYELQGGATASQALELISMPVSWLSFIFRAISPLLIAVFVFNGICIYDRYLY